MMAWRSDRTDFRLPFVVFSGTLLVTGLGTLITVHAGFSVRFLGISSVCMAALGAAPSIVCWYPIHLKSHKDRSMGSAFMISLGNARGMLAPFAFVPKYTPFHRTGYAICMGLQSWVFLRQHYTLS
jgi:hypothetical protein